MDDDHERIEPDTNEYVPVEEMSRRYERMAEAARGEPCKECERLQDALDDSVNRRCELTLENDRLRAVNAQLLAACEEALRGPCKIDRRWCVAHSEREPCSQAGLREAVAAARREGVPAATPFTTTLDCGCTVTKGYRCPFHDAP